MKCAWLVLVLGCSVLASGCPIYSSAHPRRLSARESCEQAAEMGWCEKACGKMQPVGCGKWTPVAQSPNGFLCTYTDSRGDLIFALCGGAR